MREEVTRLIPPPPHLPTLPHIPVLLPPPPSPTPRAWGVWGWVGAGAHDASLWTQRSGRGHPACLHNGIISVPASATAAVSTSCPSASTSCPWRSSTKLSAFRVSAGTPLGCWSPVSLHERLRVASLGIAQCARWLLCAARRGSAASLSHMDGRRICVSARR